MKTFLSLVLVIHAHAGILAVPHPSCRFDAKHTVLWSPVFQAGWDALNAAQQGDAKVRIDPPDKVMGWLDSFSWKAGDVLPAGGWIAHAGPMNPTLYQKTNQESKQRWGAELFAFPQPAKPGHAVLCAMVRRIEWKTPFDHAEISLLSFRSHGSTQKVRFYGSTNARDLPTVKVLHDSEVTGSFALEALCKDSDDRVIFYMPEKHSTFGEACQTILRWKKRQGLKQEDGSLLVPKLLEDEVIRIPHMALNHSADFSSLLQSTRRFADDAAPVSIQRAQQHIVLDFVSEPVPSTPSDNVVTDPFATAQLPQPRVFDFDQPFFLFLWREKAEWPYLAVWLGDASAMQWEK